ncbi:MAG: urease accessory protein UreE [Pseudomonadota bacterium]|nr:urease accessory protein UreE [Pseudomonadota bacterium]
MIEVREIVSTACDQDVTSSVTLPFEDRQKSRQRVCLDSGEQIGLFLPRGTILRGGDLLRDEAGRFIRVVAAAESLSIASTPDAFQLARCAYHLGNRHVPIQMGEGWLSYQKDHVLDEMVVGLGLVVRSEQAPFEPESGAYSQHTHHGHSHG